MIVTKGDTRDDEFAKEVLSSYCYEVETMGKMVLDAAYTVHTALGPGLLESAYEAADETRIEKGGTNVDTEVELPVRFDEAVESKPVSVGHAC